MPEKPAIHPALKIPDGAMGLRLFLHSQENGPPRKDVVAQGLHTVRDWILFWRALVPPTQCHDLELEALIPEDRRNSDQDGVLVAYVDQEGNSTVRATRLWARPKDAMVELETSVEECKVSAAIDVQIEAHVRKVLAEVLARQEGKVLLATAAPHERNGR